MTCLVDVGTKKKDVCKKDSDVPLCKTFFKIKSLFSC